MHLSCSLSLRARAGLAGLVALATLGVVPVSAGAAPAVTAPTSGSAECAAAKAALAQAKRQQAVAKADLAKARKALRKAKAAHKPVRAKKAKAAVARTGKRYRTLTRSVATRQSRMSFACASPQSAAKASAAGRTLALLAVADGLAVGPISGDQLIALLDRLLPGVTEQLTEGQFTALLAGFNAVAGGDPTGLLTILGGSFSADAIEDLLGGAGGPEQLAGLADLVISRLSGLGGLPIPEDFDLDGLLTTFAGMFGNLDPAQLGQLLALLSTATGGGGGFSLGQLTGLLDALVPGLSDQFDPEQLTEMLGAFNVGGAAPAGLADLLGGQFSPEQLAAVLGGTAAPDLIGEVISQVIAQLATAGGGGLELPGGLDLDALSDLVGTVTDLLDTMTGGGILPDLCGLFPLPGLCD